MTNNQLTENSVNQLLNSVKLARDNAERDDNRVDHSFYFALTIALEELQERRKAAMDSEPDCKERKLFCSTDTTRMRKVISVSAGTEDAPLYRHAQPVPVTEREPIAWLNDAYLARGVVDGEAGSEDAVPGYIPVYREAQPAPVVTEEMTPEMMRAVQLNSKLGAYAVSNLSGAYDLFAEFWKVACRAAMLNQK